MEQWSPGPRLVAQILAYAGKGKFQVQALDLNQEVEGMIRLLRASLSRNATLRWEPAPGLPPMMGDARANPSVDHESGAERFGRR